MYQQFQFTKNHHLHVALKLIFILLNWQLLIIYALKSSNEDYVLLLRGNNHKNVLIIIDTNCIKFQIFLTNKF